MKLRRRNFLHLAAGAAALPVVSRMAHAQAYPTRPVRIIVGFAPGGGQGRETFDATLYAGIRLWRGAEVWINPELEQGFGFDNTHGLAGFATGEAFRLGFSYPYARLQRLFLRQTINLGGIPASWTLASTS